jgi:outer membrane protein OmpA-like peptidoglycan-associated protein
MRQIFLALVFAVGTSAQAQSESFTLTEEKPLWLLLGVEGFFLTKNGVERPEVSNNGPGLAFKGVASKYFSQSWVGDLGFGYRRDRMEKDDVLVRTRAFFMELGARYRLDQRWSIGPEIHWLSGSDVSFSDVGTNSDDKNNSFFGGARLMYDTAVNGQKNLLRLGGQIMTDLNVDDRQVTALHLIAEFGWPFGPKTKPTPAPVVATSPVVPVEAAIVEEAPAPRLKLDLQNLGVNFAPSSDQLVGSSKAVMLRLANLLKKYDAEWDAIRIEGHTDSTGIYAKNLALSKARAKSVVTTLVGAGVEARKLSSEGYGPNRPLDKAKTKEAYAKNRRVELNLIGDNASQEFVSALEKLK